MNIYIDESGSMTHEINRVRNKYFVLALVLVQNPERLKKVFSRFISKHINDLKQLDSEEKMFDGGKFIELKGSCLSPDLKKQFIGYFCQNNYFKLVYIKVDNTLAHENLYRNKARAFNYILKLALENLSNRKILTDRIWNFNIDERNVKTEAKYDLQELLSTEFITGKNIVDELHVSYFDSSNNKIIQIADVFANIFYSNLMTNGIYNNEIKFMIDNGYLASTFVFPLT